MKNETKNKGIAATDGKPMLDEVISFLNKAMQDCEEMMDSFKEQNMELSASCSDAMRVAYQNTKNFILDFI